MISRLWTTSILTFGLVGLGLLATTPALAGDIGSDISRGQYTGEGGYFEIGSHLLAGNSPVIGSPKKGNTAMAAALSVSGRYQRSVGFIEVEDRRQITAGLNLWNNQTWWLDAIVSQFHNAFDPENYTALKNSALKKRKADLPIGLRATGYIGDTLVQITVLTGDLKDEHDGYVISSEIGRTWQVRNLNYHWLVGAVYESDKVTQYYFGIDSNQADATFAQYQADDSYRLFAELGLTYVLTKDWVLRSSARYTRLSEEIEDSPIIEDDYASVAALSVSYVF